MTELPRLLREHMDEPFPESVTKGETYGKVDSVMVAADVVGWASTGAAGGRLDALETQRLRAVRDDLQDSLLAFPAGARPYYETVLAIASAALEAPGR